MEEIRWILLTNIFSSFSLFNECVKKEFDVRFCSKYTLFYKQRLFSTQRQCCLTFSWIEPQMLLRCCLIHKSIDILSHLLYLLYQCPCLDLVLFILYLCDQFFSFIFSMVNCITPWRQAYMFFCLFLEYVLFFGW